jgi:uncharacterized membrane protein HdeD (DUF308 family)
VVPGRSRGPPTRPAQVPPPWQFVGRTVVVLISLTLLLAVDVHGAVRAIAWVAFGLALLSEGVATAVYWRRARRQ